MQNKRDDKKSRAPSRSPIIQKRDIIIPYYFALSNMLLEQLIVNCTKSAVNFQTGAFYH
jgi:hypothetical protein